MGCCLSKQDDEEDGISPELCHNKARRTGSFSSPLPIPTKPLTRSSSCTVLYSSSPLSPFSPPSRSFSVPCLASSISSPILTHPVPTENPKVGSPQQPVLETTTPSSFSTNLRLLGFPNSGNQCYLNATLQGLLGLISFSSDIVGQIHCWKRHSSAPLLRNMAKLQVSRYEGSRGRDKGKILKKIQRCISTISPEFSGDHQQDAHEFLVFCLMKMKEEGLALSQVGLSIRCPVANLEFQLLCVRTCNSCGLSVERTEEYNHLSIPTLHQGTLMDSLAQFFKTAELEWACSFCSGTQASEKLQFFTLPQVLVLHLKRFDGRTMVKNRCTIELASELRLSSCQEEGGFMRQLMPSKVPDVQQLANEMQQFVLHPSVWSESGESAGEPASVASHLNKAGCNTTTYHLASVVSHLGDSMESGHYICDVAQEDQKDWLCCNDSKVSRKTKSYILKKRASTAYLLFYVKRYYNSPHPGVRNNKGREERQETSPRYWRLDMRRSITQSLPESSKRNISSEIKAEAEEQLPSRKIVRSHFLSNGN